MECDCSHIELSIDIHYGFTTRELCPGSQLRASSTALVPECNEYGKRLFGRCSVCNRGIKVAKGTLKTMRHNYPNVEVCMPECDHSTMILPIPAKEVTDKVIAKCANCGMERTLEVVTLEIIKGPKVFKAE